MQHQVAVESADLFGFSSQALGLQVTRYASGVLSPAIWEGYLRASRAMCIAASETNDAALERACQFVGEGGDLLVDSGAFIYRNRPGEMPWERILTIYKRIAEAATGKVTFILPDVVGSQENTLQALRGWGNQVVEAIGPQHDALLPVQRGAQSPAAFIKEAALCLNRPLDGLAIPSNAAAFPAEELSGLADIPANIPRRVHFLGISRNSRALQDRLFRLQEFWPDAEVSCDACEHRAQVGQGKPITVARGRALDSMWDDEMEVWDETEEDPEEARELLAEQYPDLDDEAIECLMLSQMGAWAQIKAKYQQHAKVAGPKATTESIYEFACRSVTHC